MRSAGFERETLYRLYRIISDRHRMWLKSDNETIWKQAFFQLFRVLQMHVRSIGTNEYDY